MEGPFIEIQETGRGIVLGVLNLLSFKVLMWFSCGDIRQSDSKRRDFSERHRFASF